MIKGLYTAASGMMTQMVKQDTIANNIANVNSSGYKKDIAVSKAFPDMLISRLGEMETNASGQTKPVEPVTIGGLGTGACIAGIYTDYGIGNMKKTDNPTDLAIKGAGYFVIETPDGNERFTRSGAFKINNEGLLTTNQGYPVLDYFDDYIYIEGTEFTVDSLGNIFVDGEEITRLKLINFENTDKIKKLGDNIYTADEEYIEMENPEIIQGYLEESNVNAVKEMVALINVVRAYESLQKVIQAEDETLQVAIDKVGSV